jgi:hypothetical protein
VPIEFPSIAVLSAFLGRPEKATDRRPAEVAWELKRETAESSIITLSRCWRRRTGQS